LETVSTDEMFDAHFFSSRDFADAVRQFSRDNEDMNVRLEVVTLEGERLDTLRIKAVADGARLSTRDGRLVFLPYLHIAHIDFSVLQDHRIPGFQLPTSSE
jgi:hypothetical protein